MAFNANLNTKPAQPTQAEKTQRVKEAARALNIAPASEYLAMREVAKDGFMAALDAELTKDDAPAAPAPAPAPAPKAPAYMSRAEMEETVLKLVNNAKKSNARIRQLEELFDEMAQINIAQAEQIRALRNRLNPRSTFINDSAGS